MLCWYRSIKPAISIQEGQHMAGTRTAPTVNGTPTFKRVSLTVYDYTGEQRTDSYQLDADASNAEIEAFVAAVQATTNGTIWRVQATDVYNSVGDPSNAEEEVWEEASSNLVLLAKTSANLSQDWYIPAPSNDLFLEGTENIDPTNVALGAVMTAILAMRTGYSFVSARFTSRRDIGTKINF
jgi:hypothetical protein